MPRNALMAAGGRPHCSAESYCEGIGEAVIDIDLTCDAWGKKRLLFVRRIGGKQAQPFLTENNVSLTYDPYGAVAARILQQRAEMRSRVGAGPHYSNKRFNLPVL